MKRGETAARLSDYHYFMTSFYLFFFSPDFAAHYDASTLDAADAARAVHHPVLHSRRQWQTSRAAKAYLRERYPTAAVCMSHKTDYCLIALDTRSHTDKPGCDLERLTPRGITALSQQVCSEAEQKALQNSSTPLRLFYQQWTAKEALIKAEDLHFPTDMRAVGIDRPLSGRQYARYSAIINDDWLFTAFCAPPEPNSCLLYSDTPIALSDVYGQIDVRRLSDADKT